MGVEGGRVHDSVQEASGRVGGLEEDMVWLPLCTELEGRKGNRGDRSADIHF